MADASKAVKTDGRILLTMNNDNIEICVLDFGPIPDRVDQSLMKNTPIKTATENVDESPYYQIPNVIFESTVITQ